MNGACRALLAIALLSNAAPAASGERAPRALQVERFEMREGRGGLQADAPWTEVTLATVPQDPGVFWLRSQVDVSKLARQPLQPLTLFIAGMASHEIYWDGVPVGLGGVVGTSPGTETPGPIQAAYTLPETDAPANAHLLTMRMSAFHRGFSPRRGLWTVMIGDSPAVASALARETWLSLTALSGILLTAVFAFATSLVSDRRRGFLLLGTLCLTVAALLLAESWRSLHGYPYDRHLLRLLAVTALSWLVSVQLVAFVVERFRSGALLSDRLAIALPALGGVLACWLAPSWDGKALGVLALGIVTSFLWTGVAVSRGLPGARLVLAGLAAVLAGLVASPLGFASVWMFFLFDVLFVCLLVAHTLEVREERRAAHALDLLSARLETELLRRQLQPHVLMNTLTSLSEWVEEEPKTAVRMIESLADELRLLLEMASRRLVPVGDELALCRAHLATMGFRRDVHYRLQTAGLDERSFVPPALFHTLVENAVTHGPFDRDVDLRLSAVTEGERVTYRFEAPVVEGGGPPTRTRMGTGTRYIVARLREAWGDGFSFAQGREGDVWRSEIVVPAAAEVAR